MSEGEDTMHIRKAAEAKGLLTKGNAVKAGSGLGLSAAAVIWMMGTFATQKQVDRMEHKMDAIIEKVNAIHTQVVVLDALRANEQLADRKRYE